MGLIGTGPVGGPGRGKARLVAAAVLLPTAVLLGTAAWLVPDARGLGTHEQLGMQPCSIYASTGLPCATCGMTTSFALAADGRLLQSFLVQPTGAILAVLTAILAVISGYALISGMWMGPVLALFARLRTFAVLGGVVLLGWAYTAGRAWMGW